jgi:hypothetical protein
VLADPPRELSSGAGCDGADDPVRIVAVSRLTYWPFVGAADKLSRLMLQTVEREFVQLILGSSPRGPML